MQVHHKPTKILLVGKSGSGKSTYQLRFVQNSNYARYFIFDHKLEFQERLGIVPCYDCNELVEKLQNPKHENDKYLSYSPLEEYAGNSELGFQYFCEWSYEIAKALCEDDKKSLFVCDEVNRFTTSSDLGWEFRQLIEDGRLQGLDFIGTSHAANAISNKLRLQLSEIVALKTIDSRPLEFLEECGFDPDEIRNLDIGEFIARDLDRDEFHRGRLFGKARQEMPSEEKELTDGQELPSKGENDLNQTKEQTNALPKTPTSPNPVHGDGNTGRTG